MQRTMGKDFTHLMLHCLSANAIHSLHGGPYASRAVPQKGSVTSVHSTRTAGLFMTYNSGVVTFSRRDFAYPSYIPV